VGLLSRLLNDPCLAQLDGASLDALSLPELDALTEKRLQDLKAARERLNLPPGNRSRPPSRQVPVHSRGVL
jgi:hypothetical protein